MNKLSLGTIWLPKNKPSVKSSMVQRKLTEQFPGITSGNFNHVDLDKCRFILVVPEVNNFETDIEVTPDVRDLIIAKKIKVFLAYTPSYAEYPVYYETNIGTWTGVTTRIKGIANTVPAAYQFMKTIYDDMAETKTLDDFGGDMEAYMQYHMDRVSEDTKPSKPKKKHSEDSEDLIFLRVKTEEEIKAEGRWVERGSSQDGYPEGWNSAGGMNFFLGKTFKVSKKTFQIFKDNISIYSSDLRSKNNSPEIENALKESWIFRPWNFITEPLPEKEKSTEETVTFRFVTSEECIKNTSYSLPFKWVSKMRPLLGTTFTMPKKLYEEYERQEFVSTKVLWKYAVGASEQVINICKEDWSIYFPEEVVVLSNGTEEPNVKETVQPTPEPKKAFLRFKTLEELQQENLLDDWSTDMYHLAGKTLNVTEEEADSIFSAAYEFSLKEEQLPGNFVTEWEFVSSDFTTKPLPEDTKDAPEFRDYSKTEVEPVKESPIKDKRILLMLG